MNIHRQHIMPFGAAILADGSVRFRLWAPRAQRVELCLGRSADDVVLEMSPQADGWYEQITASAMASSYYRFRIDGDLHVPDPASRFQPDDVHGASEVVSEIWRAHLLRWARINRRHKRKLDNGMAPSRNDEYLLYQTLVGMWPMDSPNTAGLARVRERVRAYMIKAVREAKVYTSWINPNGGYEDALNGFVQALFDAPERNPFLADFTPLAHGVARCGYYNSLSQTLLKLMAPGVPDIYQGSELWDFSLVDPDNRRPVDYPARDRLLKELEEWDHQPERLAERVRSLLDTLEDGRAKLYLTWRLLNFHRVHGSVGVTLAISR